MSSQPQKASLAKRPGFLALVSLAVVGVLAGIYLVLWGESNVDASESASELQVYVTGEMANLTVFEADEPVETVSFVDETGKERHFEEWRGKVLLVNLWATWCGPCRHEMPALDRLQAQLGSEDFEVLAISLDRSGLELPRTFYAENDIHNLKLFNDATAQTGVKLGVFGMPTTVLIDRQGRLIGRLVGPAEWDAPEAVSLIEAAIAG
jgi:thiol-disulfide isomerase/thioredoxin